MAATTARFFYFAYGSNLLKERLILKNPSAQFQAVGKLKDYKLVFVGKARRWEGGVANIRQMTADGGDVWGVIWCLDISDMPTLDKQESIYTPMEVEVTDIQGQKYQCRTYQLRLPGEWAEENLPSPHYKDILVRGALQNGLPESYVQALESREDNGYQGKVAVYDDVLALLSGGDGKK